MAVVVNKPMGPIRWDSSVPNGALRASDFWEFRRKVLWATGQGMICSEGGKSFTLGADDNYALGSQPLKDGKLWPRLLSPVALPRIVRFFICTAPYGTPMQFAGDELPAGATFPNFSKAVRRKAWEDMVIAVADGFAADQVGTFTYPVQYPPTIFGSSQASATFLVNKKDNMIVCLHGAQATDGSFAYGYFPEDYLRFVRYLSPPSEITGQFLAAETLNIIIYTQLGVEGSYYFTPPVAYTTDSAHCSFGPSQFDPSGYGFNNFYKASNLPEDAAVLGDFHDQFPSHDTFIFLDEGEPNQEEYLYDHVLLDCNSFPGNVYANFDFPSGNANVASVTNVWAQMQDQADAELTDYTSTFAGLGLSYKGRINYQTPDPAQFVTLIRDHFNL